ncbi:MAG: haloacid dehalogenase-like hydrolase [Gammaproteobacteria bacterium]|nr:haloacid dehalogenase-like hydrolase [Gammaproteobacteria bacterium]
MKRVCFNIILFVGMILGSLNNAAYAKRVDPLPSWNDTKNKNKIVRFVKAVTRAGGKDFVPVDARIATFDMDGTILIEKPGGVFFTALFTKQMTSGLPPQDLAILSAQVIEAIKANDMEFLNQLAYTSYQGMTQTDAIENVLNFVENTEHPGFGATYIDLFYQPMLELIAYLEDNDFEVFVVSGSLQFFTRSVVNKKTNIKRTNLIGPRMILDYKTNPSHEQIDFIRTGTVFPLEAVGNGKALAIDLNIGVKPILAFGNTGGDQQMLEYASTNTYRNLSLLLNHDDNARECAYPIAGATPQKDWVIVSMKDDFATVFKDAKKEASGGMSPETLQLAACGAP